MFRNGLLQTTLDEKKRILSTLNLTEESLSESAQNIQDWYKLQPHLPKPPPDLNDIKMLFLFNKASMEKVKRALDMKCLLRSVRPEFFKFSDFVDSGFHVISKNVYWFSLPKLSNDLCRINILKLVGDPEDFSLVAHLKRGFMFADYRVKNGCSLADKYVIDLEHMKWGHLTKINPVTLKNGENANKAAYGARIAGIHILNAPPFIDKFLNLLRGVLKPKLFDRIKCHSTLEDLHEYLPKEILPVEYGGYEESIDVINDKWHKELSKGKWREMFINDEKLVSDESKRIDFTYDQDLLGLQGSFKKLDFD